MKRAHILDALQVVTALLITGSMATAMTPPATPKTNIAVKDKSSSKAPEAPVNAPAPAKAQPATPAPNPPPAPPPAPVAPPPPDCTNPHSIMAAAGVPESAFGAVDYIVTHEGGWCGATRYNTGGSGAYGICQSLPGGKMASAGADWATNPVTQLKWCDGYANARYGGWWLSYQYWVSHRNW